MDKQRKGTKEDFIWLPDSTKYKNDPLQNAFMHAIRNSGIISFAYKKLAQWPWAHKE